MIVNNNLERIIIGMGCEYWYPPRCVFPSIVDILFWSLSFGSVWLIFMP